MLNPAKILIGIPLDSYESKELLCWAIDILARPGDTLVALHVVGAMPEKKGVDGDGIKRQFARKQQKQIRQAKSFIISIMGELFRTCQANEVNLEARVGLSWSTGKGLVEEAKNMAADYLIIGGKKHRSSRSDSNSFMKNLWSKIARVTFTVLPTRVSSSSISSYCCKNVPQGCSLILVRRTQPLQQHFAADSMRIQDLGHQSNGSWSEKNSYVETSFSSSEENEENSSAKIKRPSPRRVLDICEEDSNSNTDGDSWNSAESCTSLTAAVAAAEPRKPRSPFNLISSIFCSSRDWSIRKKTCALFGKEKEQPLLRCFTYQEIANATNNFHKENLVGQGGYSEVYKGEAGKKSSIAVKRLAKDNTNANKETEFLIELGIIGHVNHPNTAKLVGYCIEKGLYLIFNFYPNGTLSSALHGQTSKALDWAVRYRIILGIARGLHYLHKCCKHRIIHRDIKASNVLLGPDYEPQISDFGLAKWLPNKWSHHAVIPIEGTFGYLAPGYFMYGIVDEKTDVFAFGILLLEIVTGRRPIDNTRQNLLLWARPLMESGNLREIADPKLEGRYIMEQLYRVALTASYCVRQSSIWRPSMTEVLQLLTNGQDSEIGRRSWRIPKFTSDEIDDYSDFWIPTTI